jgi:hypothetical protein
MQMSGRGTFVPLAFAARGGVPVRLERGLGDHRRRAHQAAGGAFKLSYSRAFFVRAYPLQTHEMLFDAHNHAFRVWAACRARHLRQHAHGGRQGRPRQGADRSMPASGHGQPLSLRGRVLQSGSGLGEGTGREERSGCAPPPVAPMPQLSEPGCAERSGWRSAARRTVAGDPARDRARQRSRMPGPRRRQA